MDPLFLLLALFLPRLALFYFWVHDGLPPLPMPSWGELVLAVAVPRFIVLFMVYQTMGLSFWFWLHLVAALSVFLGSAFIAAKD